jgi:AbiV family abortive infection protein
MKQRLQQHRGGLTSVQIADGINAAKRNASRLCDDASLLLERGRYPGAVALAILSIEESGKCRILRELALARDQDELLSSWREYRQHTSKNQMWLLIDSLLKGASKLSDFSDLFDPSSDHPQVLDQLKQISIYTDCLGNAHWSIPDDVVDIGLAKMLTETAKVLCQSRKVTAEEVELWIAYLQPAYKASMEAMENALIAWDREMRARGLTDSANSTMEQFIRSGLRYTG